MSTSIEAVRAVVTRLVHLIDRQQYPQLVALFAEQVAVDYTSLFGGSPSVTPAAELVGGWQKALAHVTTQHLLGPIEVEASGGRARAECHVRAMHFRAGAPGGEEWEVLGHYVFGLVESGGWRIEQMKLETHHQLGNRKLLGG